MHYRDIILLPEGCLRMPETRSYAYSCQERTLAKFATNVQGESWMAMSMTKESQKFMLVTTFIMWKFVACQLLM